MNYFDLFGLQIKYKINYKLLTKIYHNLQKKYHPDAIDNKNNKIINTLQISSLINEGYKILKNPIKRAEHILQLNKININSKKYFIKNTNFLLKNIHLHEELNKIQNMKNKQKKLSIFYKKIKKYKKKYTKLIEKQLNKNRWIISANTLNKLRFMDKLQKKINKEYLSNDF